AYDFFTGLEFRRVLFRSEEFPVGGSKTLRRSAHDAVTLIGAGVTLHEALGAADALAEEGVQARVIDAYSVKPIDAEGIRAAVARSEERRIGQACSARGSA